MTVVSFKRDDVTAEEAKAFRETSVKSYRSLAA